MIDNVGYRSLTREREAAARAIDGEKQKGRR
jgi:hypothetical protein